MKTRKGILLCGLFALSVTWPAAAGAAEKVTVGLDRHYNHETRGGRPYHYAWEDTRASGYSQFGQLLRGLGAEITSVRNPASKQALAGVDIYIIVDPDTPKETKNPNYIEDEAIEAIVEWVHGGGVLVLLNNNEGETEFEHVNKLAGRFGITFNQDTRFGIHADPQKLQMHSFPDHPFFKGVEKLHMRSICTLTVKPPAKEVYNFQGDSIMALCQHGKGTVFALGDPWIYNEYIKFHDNIPCAKNVFGWLIEKTRQPGYPNGDKP